MAYQASLADLNRKNFRCATPQIRDD
jgi:hypothetical protein